MDEKDLPKDQLDEEAMSLLTVMVTDINTFIAVETAKLGCDKDKVQELIKKIITMYY